MKASDESEGPGSMQTARKPAPRPTSRGPQADKPGHAVSQRGRRARKATGASGRRQSSTSALSRKTAAVTRVQAHLILDSPKRAKREFRRLVALHQAARPTEKNGKVDSVANIREQRQALVRELESQQTIWQLQMDRLRKSVNELQQSSEQDGPGYENAPLGYVTLDPAAVVLEMNAAAAALLDIRHPRIKGWSFTLVVLPTDFRILLDHLRRCRVVRGRPVTSELTLRTLGQRNVPVQIVTVPFRPDRGALVYPTALVDLTERKRAEQVILNAREYAESVVQAVPTPLLVLDSKLMVVRVNTAFCETFRTLVRATEGWLFEDLEGLDWSRSDLTGLLRSVLATGTPLRALELTCRLSPLGAELVLLLEARRLEPRRGVDQRLIVALEDVTRRKQAQVERERLFNKLQKAGAELEQRVEERTLELQAVNRRLEEMSTLRLDAQELERRRLARELHDGVGQSLTALKLSLLGRMQACSEKGAKTLKEAADEISDVLEQIRQMSRDLRPHVLDDLGLLAALDWHFTSFETRTGIRIRFHHSGLNEAFLDPRLQTAVFRIVQETLTNVARHAQADRASVRLRQSPSSVALTVSDQGIGFDLKKARHSAASGLSGIRERALLAHGTYKIKSKPGGGTTITVELPIGSGNLPPSDEFSL